jgi:hypothetical protein
MTHWNHRVVRRTFEDDDEVRYGIYEAYYDDNGLIWAITEKPVNVDADDIDGLRKQLEWMQKALEHPILDYNNIPEPGANSSGGD